MIMNFSEADIKFFPEKQENAMLFKAFLASEEERRELKEIPATELQEFVIKFVIGVFFLST